MNQRFAALAMAGILLTSTLPAASAAEYQGKVSMTIGSPTMLVNGFAMPIDAEGSRASIYGSSTVLPIRGLLESMGGTVSWNDATRSVTMQYNGETVVVTLGSKTAVVNGKNVTMDVAPFTDNGRTYVWVRTVEFFQDVTVSWDATTRTATVLYKTEAPTGTPITLSVQNGTYNLIKSMSLAPADTDSYSSNIMGSDIELFSGERGNYQIAIQPGVYDLRVTDVYGNNFTYRHMDLSTVQAAAFVTLTGGATYSIALDGLPASVDRTTNLYLINSTGKAIQNVRYSQRGSWAWQEVPASYIGNGNNGIIAIPFNSAQPYYDLLVTYTNGTSQAFQNVNMNYTPNSVMVTLRSDDFVYGRDYHSVAVTFENRLGEDIEELYIYSGSFSDADDLLSRDLDDGEKKTFNLDLGGTTKWYLRAYTDDDDYVSGSVSIDKSTEKATIRLDSDEDYTVRYQDYGGWGDASDEYEITVANFGTKKIEAMFFVDESELDYIAESYDVEDLEDDYDDEGSLSVGSIDTYDVSYVDKYDEVGLVVIYGDYDDDDDMDDIDAEFFSLDFDGILQSGVVVIDDDEATAWSDDFDEDEYTVVVYNADDAAIDADDFMMSEEDEEEDDKVLSSSLAAGKYVSFELDLEDDHEDYAGGMDFYFKGDEDDAQNVDLTDHDVLTFVIVDGTNSDDIDIKQY